MNAVELSVIAKDEIDGKKVVRLETVEQLVQKSAVLQDSEVRHWDRFHAYFSDKPKYYRNAHRPHGHI